MKPVKGREQLRAHLHKRQVRSEHNRWKNLTKKTNFGIEAQVVVLRLVWWDKEFHLSEVPSNQKERQIGLVCELFRGQSVSLDT